MQCVRIAMLAAMGFGTVSMSQGQASAAVVVDFSTAQGYTNGPLNGQPIVDGVPGNWGGPAGSNTSYTVDAAAGVLNYANNHTVFNGVGGLFTQSQLGFSPVNPLDDMLVVSFSLNYLANSGVDNGGIEDDQNIEILIRDTSERVMSQMFIRGSGAMRAGGNGANGTFLGDDLTSTSGWVEFTMVLNFSTQEAEYFRGDTSYGSFDFINLSARDNETSKSAFQFILKQNYNNRTGGGFQWQMTDLTLAQVPEPASLSLLGVGGLTLLRRRR